MKTRSLLAVSFVALLFHFSAPVHAAKILINKEMLFSEDGRFEGHAEFPPEVLDEFHVALIADYQTFLAGEVIEDDLSDFLLLANEKGLAVEVRRDFDLVAINGYSFSSFGDGPDLPANLRIDSYDGEMGLYLVQLRSPATTEWLAGLRSIGSILSYHPQNTFLVRMSHDDSELCRHLSATQHVSLYQPAYKIPTALLDSNRPVKVSVRLDDDQDLSTVVSFLGDMTSGEIDVRRGTTIVELDVDEMILTAKRSEVLWMEPLYSIEFSGERQAMVVAGLHNGTRPDDPEPGATHDGYEEWILDKGFCTPDSAPLDCYPYWTKVGVFGSGLNTMVCSSHQCVGSSRNQRRDREPGLCLVRLQRGPGTVEGNERCIFVTSNGHVPWIYGSRVWFSSFHPVEFRPSKRW